MRIKKGYFSSNLLRKFETKACKENLPDNMQFKSLKEEHPLLPSESRSVCKERLSASEKNRKL